VPGSGLLDPILEIKISLRLFCDLLDADDLLAGV